MNAATNATAPDLSVKIGEGMTLSLPQDSYPYVVVGLSASGKTAKVKPLKIVDTKTGHEPAYYEGPFPVWSHSYTDEELISMAQEDAPERTVRLTKNGWTSRGINFNAGGAYYHRNYSY